MKHVITIEGEVDPQNLEQYVYSDLDCDIKSLNDSGLAKLHYTVDKGNGAEEQ